MWKNGTPLWREACKSKCTNTKHLRGGPLFEGKWHAAVARSTFASQNVQNTSGADRFLKVRCGKIARRCSEKHICKSKCEKHEGLGPFFEVRMPNNCRKMTRRCGAKHTCKSKCTKHQRFAPLLQVPLCEFAKYLTN